MSRPKKTSNHGYILAGAGRNTWKAYGRQGLIDDEHSDRVPHVTNMKYAVNYEYFENVSPMQWGRLISIRKKHD